MADLDLAKLYDRHAQGLFTHALTITRDRAMAEDAVHAAFERLCRRSPASVDDPAAYVFAAVRMSAVELCRRRARSRAAGRIEVPDSVVDLTASPAARAIERERAASVAAALEDLSGEQREVVVLRLYAGLTFAQIAAVLGEPLPTVASRYRRSLDLLRGCLEKLV